MLDKDISKRILEYTINALGPEFYIDEVDEEFSEKLTNLSTLTDLETLGEECTISRMTTDFKPSAQVVLLSRFGRYYISTKTDEVFNNIKRFVCATKTNTYYLGTLG